MDTASRPNVRNVEGKSRHRGAAGLYPAALAAIALSLPVLAQPSGVAHAQAATAEYAVKAAFLYKFAPFMTWPPTAFDAPTSPLAICVVGRDPFGPVLDQAVNGQKFDQHPIQVRRLKAIERRSGCHIVYLGGSAAQSVPDALTVLKGEPVVTVTDADSGEVPGVMQFVMANNHVRFDVDDQAAAQNGIVISSNLLKIAHSVRPRSQERRP